MQPIFDFFFDQYSGYPTLFIILEIIAVIFGFLSVWYSKQNNILVYPTGIVSTMIFVYLLWQWQLLGDMMINAYYFSMSIYGWYIWTRKVDATHFTPITSTTRKEQTQSV
ncbi:MAG: nicotinamide riboside transporter PnuC, partial [Christiangramia sp.]